MVSKLAVMTVPTTKKAKRKSPVTKITIHHMAGMTDAAENVAKAHANSKKDVSANYYIDNRGRVVAGAEEEYRAFTSSNRTNDDQAITIEVSNCMNKSPWEVCEKAYVALIELCADICRRYNIVPHYDGTRNGTLTVHRQFAKTVCPGPYLFGMIENGTVEKAINSFVGLTTIPTTPQERKRPEDVAKEVISGKWGVGEDRKNRLTKAGYNYREIQKIVNNMLKGR